MFMPDALGRSLSELAMLTIPNTLINQFVSHLNSRGAPAAHIAEYKKWLRYFLDFCDKYPVPSSKGEQIRLFCEKLKEKNQSEAQRKRAAHAVSLYFEMIPQQDKDVSASPLSDESAASKQPGTAGGGNAALPFASPSGGVAPSYPQPYYVSEEAPRYSTGQSRRSQYNEAGYQETSKSPEWDAAIETMADEIKVRHYSRKTLQTYAKWTRNFQYYLKNKPPVNLGSEDVKDYLTYLAVKCKVAASTQNQAFNSLLFFYRNGLKREFGELRNVPEARGTLLAN